MNDVLNPLERAVLMLALAGDDPILRVLRSQLAVATTRERKFTGVGFFTSVHLPPSVAKADSASIRIADVVGELPGLEHGAGFVVFVDDGLLSALEGFTFDEAWPSGNPSDFKLAYMQVPRARMTPGVTPGPSGK
jgi:hypothetical protein